jgi:SAM-dependent methyltransferase
MLRRIIDGNASSPAIEDPIRMATVKDRVRHAIGVTIQNSPAGVKRLIRRGSTSLLAAVDRGESAGAGEPPSGWQSPTPPVPDGLTFPDMERSFRSWSVNHEPVGHLDAYVDDSILRFLHTWGMVRNDAGACLELGANPYFTTSLLDRHTNLDLTLANFYGTRGETTETLSFVPAGTDERIEVTRHSYAFNLEEDEFPFDAGSFDVVLFCEILEHLLMNPLAALRQIHRVLKPGGVLILTTPNVARLDNVLAMINGANIYDPYSGFGPYGRHNREYNRHELHRLLNFAGFDVESSFTADGHDGDPRRWPGYDRVAPEVRFRHPDLVHYLFVRAVVRRPSHDHLPSFLYRSWPEGDIVPYD